MVETIYACSFKAEESGDVSFYDQSTSEVAERALRESSENSNGVLEVENDLDSTG
jgi:hypothetical protein